MQLLNTLSTWPAQRWPWLLLSVSALLLECTALFFQYAMGLEPCVMCIYQRVAVVGLILAPLPAIIKPDNLIARLVSLIASLTAAIWGLRIAYEHVQMQNPDNFMLLLGCDVIPNFPQWLPLHQWLPGIFEARGTCGDIDWSFLGQSMPQWMVIIFAGYSLVIASVYTIRLVKVKNL